MSHWKTLFGNTRGAKERGPTTVVAHILDPNSGYRQQKWLVGKQLTQEVVDRLGENGEVFVVIAYEGGKPKSAICKKAVWLQTKAQFEAIEGDGHGAMAPKVQTLTRGSRERPIVIDRPPQVEALRQTFRQKLAGTDYAAATQTDAQLDAMIAEFIKMSVLEEMLGKEGATWQCGKREYKEGAIQTQEVIFKDGRASTVLFFDFSRFGGSPDW